MLTKGKHRYLAENVKKERKQVVRRIIERGGGITDEERANEKRELVKQGKTS